MRARARRKTEESSGPRRAVAVLASLLLVGCSGVGGSGSGTSASSAAGGASSGTGSPSGSASPVAQASQGAAVRTTSADVAGFSLAQHTTDTTDTSPDRQKLSSSTIPAGFEAAPAGSGRQRYLDQKITWTACGAFQCGTVLVPLDWDHPDGQAITLKMKKKPATSKKTATLFVNPGGPGGSGQDMVDSFDSTDFPDHDIIGWDPRGSGESTPVACGTSQQTDAYLALDNSPTTSAAWTTLIDGDKAFAKECRDGSGVLLDHIDTIETARDLDYLRYLVGDKKLDYLGVSYGTYIGSMYAELYPQRTGRMVLDSAVNITDNDTVTQQMGFDKALTAWADWCVTNSCGLGTTRAEVLKAATGVLDQLSAHPLQVQGRELTEGLGLTGLVTYLYMGQDGYQMLTTAIRAAQAGDGSQLLATADLMNGRDTKGQYGSLTYAFPAIACADASDPGLAGAKKEIAQDEKQAPVLGKYFGADLTCTYWSARPAPQLVLKGKGAAPILVLGATGDPATPYQQAVWMAQQLQSGVLLTWKGAGHSVWELGNACAKGAVRSFVNEGTVPKDGTTC